jgi:anaphase-promoting complex subunit 10
MYASPSFEVIRRSHGDRSEEDEEEDAPTRARRSPPPPARTSSSNDDGADDGAEVDNEDPEEEEDDDHNDEIDDEDDEGEDEGEAEEDDDDGDANDTTTPAAAETANTTTETTANAAAASTNVTIPAVAAINLGPNVRELGKEALCWQLSSAKPGNGVEQIRDGSNETYWQSDGLKQPHWIQVHFARRVAVSHVCLYLDYSLDESYTPKRLAIHHGMTNQDLQPACSEVDLHEPTGWCVVPLPPPADPLDEEHEEAKGCLRAHLLRIAILSMHQNGRDTHVRQVELYGPRLTQPRGMLLPPLAARPKVTKVVDTPENQDDDDDSDDDLGMIRFPAVGVIR